MERMLSDPAVREAKEEKRKQGKTIQPFLNVYPYHNATQSSDHQ
jgi:hypothetical protein